MTESEWLASTDPQAMLEWLENTRVARGSLAHKFNHSTQQYDIGPSDRKLRLFVSACCRASRACSVDADIRECVQAAEDIADVLCPPLIDDGISIMSCVLDRAVSRRLDVSETEKRASSAAACCHWDRYNQPACIKSVLAHTSWLGVTGSTQADALRDIIGNPFRSVEVNPAWLTPLAVSLATAAYDNRLPSGQLDPEILAVLSDALEDAGCPVSIQTCYLCNGTGIYQQEHPWGDTYAVETLICHACQGERTGAIPHPLLTHLRSPGPHWRGCWAVDLLLGKE